MLENTVRLAKAASQLGVGTDTIAEFLRKKGLVENPSPTTKITPEVYELLQKEFKTSADLKERADKLSIGTKKRERLELDEHGHVHAVIAEEALRKNAEKSKELSEDILSAKETLEELLPTEQQPAPAAIVDSKDNDEPETPAIVEQKETEISLPKEEIAEQQPEKQQAENIPTPIISETVIPEAETHTTPAASVETIDTPLPPQPVAEVPEQKTVVEPQPEIEIQQPEKIVATQEETPETKTDASDSSFKVVGKIDLSQFDRTPKGNAPKQQPPQQDNRKENRKNEPKHEPKKETPKQQQHEPRPQQQHTPPVKNTPVKETVKSATETPPVSTPPPILPKIKKEEEIQFIETQKVTLTGPKVIGKIELPDKNSKFEQDNDKSRKRKRKRVKKAVDVENKPNTPNSNTPNNNTNNNNNNNNNRSNQSGGSRDNNNNNNRGGNAPDRSRPSSGGGTHQPASQSGHQRQSSPSNQNTPSQQKGNTPPPAQKHKKKGGKDRKSTATGVSGKEVQDNIRSTMAKMGGGTKKNLRSKIRRDKRDLRAAAESDAEMPDNLLQVTEFITVSELASLMEVAPAQIISMCMKQGSFVSINQRLDAEMIEYICLEFGYDVEFIGATEQENDEEEQIDAPEDLEGRPPIVTIMGHVDHGKTSLLDYIRNSNVVAGEMGGITQHIGAYEVTTSSGKSITFLDTPGHEAFTAMRARGAKVTDIAIIVIAADDAIMPQTREAISHAQAAGVPMIFAINKIDKDGANSTKIKEQLAAMNLLVEDWGGKYQSQEISAKKGLNIDALLEKVLLEAELLELKANPNRTAVGSVIEASLDKGRGYVTTVLVQTGTLHVGDIVLAGTNWGRIKAMFNERGNKLKEAGPSAPVLILGLNGAPQAGERLRVFEDEQEAKALASKREQLIREQGLRTKKHITLDEIGRRRALGNFKELNIIVKGDFDGSVEALSDSLLKLSTPEIQLNIIHKSVGQISESDVLLASASDAIIVGFQVRPSSNARKMAENENIDLRLYSIIYDAIEEIKKAMEGMLEPDIEEKFVCNVEVREVFKVSNVGTVAGCFVQEGKVQRNTKVRLVREGIVVYTGEIETLKRFKDDAKEVIAGMECGIALKNFNDIKTGDFIEGYEEIQIKRKL